MLNDIVIKRLHAGDVIALQDVADDVFDNPVRQDLAREFLQNDRNILVVALDQGKIVGMASGHFYIHPDKDEELWVNELGVSPAYQRKGIATAILGELTEIADRRKCKSCWLLTEPDNMAANALYRSLPGWQGPEKTFMYSIQLHDSDTQ